MAERKVTTTTTTFQYDEQGRVTEQVTVVVEEHTK
jgi:YD repeat-containing protein